VPLLPENTAACIEVLIELCRNKELRHLSRPMPGYFLALFHQCLSQQSLMPSFIVLLEEITNEFTTFSSLASAFLSFTKECLKAYLGAISS